MSARILVVDDEASIRFSLQRALERDGHEVWTAEDGYEALRLVQQNVFDLILTDLKMGSVDGVEVMRQARAMSPDTAVIMLTGYATLESAIEALRQGAVDYLVKPCASTDIRASVQKGLSKRFRELRRRELLEQMSDSLAELREETFLPPDMSLPLEMQPELPPLYHGDLMIDRVRHVSTLRGRHLELTPTEFNLLAYMAENSDRVLSCRELVSAAHGYETSEDEARKVIRPHITNLRQKLSSLRDRRPYILNVRGVGYVLAPVGPRDATDQKSH